MLRTVGAVPQSVNGEAYDRVRAASGLAECRVDALELGGRSIEQMAQPFEGAVPEGATFVLGDCAPVSVDSRVWGPLDDSAVQGRPILRIWPPERFGPLM
jgi:type IV secretory pathway protease TraF